MFQNYVFAADNLPYAFYERTADGTEHDITDELPFEIPESWEWVRLRSLGVFSGGKTPSMSNSKFWAGGKIPWISSKDMKAKNITSSEMMITQAAADTMKIYAPGTIVMVVRSGILKRFLPLSFLAVQATINQDLKALELFDNSIGDFLYYAIKAFEPYILFELVKAVTTVDSLKFDEFRDLFIPFPPMDEQARIVANLFIIEKYVDDYDIADQKLTALNASFPDILKKSILQAAVQGKLVEQDPNDEPASVLLERIRTEKAALVKTGKAKKSKHESVIFRRDNSHYEILDGIERCIDDEIPFDIPDSWEWCRLNSLGQIVGGGTPKTDNSENWRNGTIPWLTPADMKYVSGRYVSHGERNISEQGLSRSSAQLMPENTIVYSSRAPIGYVAIASNPLSTNQGFKSVVPYFEGVVLYLYYCLIQRTPEIQSRASGTTFKEISGGEFGLTLIPLPPFTEQSRIVERIEELELTRQEL